MSWLLLTLLLEFGSGRLLGHSWSKLLEDYNIFEGRLWILILLFTALSPYLFFRLFKTNAVS
ncbi:MAG: hypothetical protein H7Y86_13055 [Rhizobacter sp.]|nr:hypothetical protein [Ferruginibacter sp.]